MEGHSSAILPPDANSKHYDTIFRLVYPATYQDTLNAQIRQPENIARYHELIAPVLASLSRLRTVLLVLEKYDAELKKRRFPRTVNGWAKQIDEAKKTTGIYGC